MEVVEVVDGSPFPNRAKFCVQDVSRPGPHVPRFHLLSRNLVVNLDVGKPVIPEPSILVPARKCSPVNLGIAIAEINMDQML